MRLQGAIRKLKKTYGFIAGDDGLDYFLHWSAMHPEEKDFRELRERERVEFDTVTGKDGKLRAVDIRMIAKQEQAGV
jgi:cold shock CspA family protein